MKTYYLDADFRVHTEAAEDRIPWADESGFFNGKSTVFIEGYRVVPEGSEWKHEDGAVFPGLMIAPAVDYETLDKAQTEQAEMRDVMDVAGTMLTDEQAATVPALYRPWEPGVDYAVGDRRTYNGTLFKCLQAHTALDDWNPVDAPSLWAAVLIPDPSVIPEWVQPDSTNPYMTGDKVTHNGKTWISDVDNNVWEPGEYGWSEVTT